MKTLSFFGRIIALTGLFLISFSASAQDPKFYIFLCFGQSNMEGQGPIESVDNNVDSRFRNMSALTCSNRTMGTWYTANPPLCRCNTKIGPIDNFGKVMVANLPADVRVGVVHVAIAGCKIELFDKVNYNSYASGVDQWMKDIIALYGGNPYARLVEVAKLAQKDGVIKGILMHQGESNTGDAQWPNKVKGVYDNLIKDLGLDATKVPLLAGQVVDAAQGGQCASMNNTINTLPNTIPNSYVISSSGCTDQSDNLHFTSAGYRLLGERYAMQMLKLIVPDNSPTVTITAPTATAAFSAPASITITASAKANNTNGTISLVEFFNGNDKLGQATAAPYSYVWNDVSTGSYTIKVVATDNEGNKSTATIAVGVQGSYTGKPHAIPGTIQFEEFDLGGNNVAYYDDSQGSSVTPVVDFRTTEDVDIEKCSDAGAGYNLGYTTAGEWLEYTVDVAAAGKYDIDLRVACNGTGRTISLAMDATTIANNISIPNTTDWQKWETISVKGITLAAGKQVLRLTIGSTDYVNLNYITFTSQTTVVDNCPNDPNKLEPGTCGCGVADTDTDKDGTPDCDDLCPSDASKQKPGACGCGVAEGTCSVAKIKLRAGWNVIGCPVDGSTEISKALASIWSQVEVVKNYDSFYASSNQPALNSLSTLNWGEGYLVKVKSSCELDWNVK